MSSLDDLLLGKILVNNKFVTSDQVSECIEIQAKSSPSRPLGEIMKDKGYVTEAQLKLVLSLQSRHRKKESSPVRDVKKKEDTLFGNIVLMKRLAREGQIEECLKIQKEFKKTKGKYLKLGEILVQKAYLTKYQVEEILRIQQNRQQALLCELCKTPFEIEELAESVKYTCNECDFVLKFPKA